MIEQPFIRICCFIYNYIRVIHLCFNTLYIMPLFNFVKTYDIVYTNIDQTLVNSLHGLLNCEIGGLDCRAITPE